MSDQDIRQKLSNAITRIESVDNPSSRQLYYLSEFRKLINNTPLNYERELAIIDLLVPVIWDSSSSIPSRKSMVLEARTKVLTVLPFLDTEHSEMARKWLKENEHSGLWD